MSKVWETLTITQRRKIKYQQDNVEYCATYGGVFAKKQFQKGQLVCYFDGVDIETPSQEEQHERLAFSSPKYPAGVRLGTEKSKHALFVGQFIQDYWDVKKQTLFVNGRLIIRSNEIRVLDLGVFDEYYKYSQAHANVEFVNNQFGLYATRDIALDEKLYISYGVAYWLRRIVITNFPRTLQPLMKFVMPQNRHQALKKLHGTLMTYVTLSELTSIVMLYIGRLCPYMNLLPEGHAKVGCDDCDIALHNHRFRFEIPCSCCMEFECSSIPQCMHSCFLCTRECLRCQQRVCFKCCGDKDRETDILCPQCWVCEGCGTYCAAYSQKKCLICTNCGKKSL